MADPSVLETQVSEQISIIAEDGDGEEVYNPEDGQDSIEEEEAPVPEVLDEIPDDSQLVAGLASQIEEVPKKSYASIVSLHSEISLPFWSIPAHTELQLDISLFIIFDFIIWSEMLKIDQNYTLFSFYLHKK